jgi:TIR domain
MNVFISYSPADSELVSAIVSLLCANNSSLACCDADSMRTSGRWREELGTAISESNVVLVFWCHHSQTSYEVRKEFALALEQGKDILPLLMDGTPLPSKLANRRTIDFRDRLGVVHEGLPGQVEPGDVAERVVADRLIASDLSRQYEELLVMSLAREIEAELASRLGPN